jgi:hypothetical protein
VKLLAKLCVTPGRYSAGAFLFSMVKAPLTLIFFLSLPVSSAPGQSHTPLVNASNGFDETLTFDDNQVPPGWTLDLIGGSSNAQIANMRFEAGEIDTDAALDKDKALPANTDAIEITLRCDLIQAQSGMGYQIHLVMQDGSDFLVSVTKQPSGNRLDVMIGNAAAPELVQIVFAQYAQYGTYLFDVLFTDGNITFNGTKEVGDVTPAKDVAVPGLAIADLKTVRLEAMMSSGGSAWIDDVQILALTGSESPSRFGNISTRLDVGLDTNVLIGGFIVSGTEPKRVLLRAIGPSLPLGGVLADPVLELHNSKGATIATNDNWADSPDKQEIIDTTIPPIADKESAIVETFNPGAYTAIVSGKDGGTGVGLVEVYDLDQTYAGTLANVSTRGEILVGDNVMIGGLIITGPSAVNVLLRAIGPSLAITGALADPTLELHDRDGVVMATNDNWRSDQETEIIATAIPPLDDAESAILATLVPSSYTAIARGSGGATGIALVEAYQLQ